MAGGLQASDIQALLTAVNAGAVEPAPARDHGPKVSPYDFKRPERVGKDQIRALERLHEVFARNVGATLSGQMRSLIDCRLVGTEQATYQEFTLAVANPTCFNFIEADQLQGEWILDINPRLVFSMFDKLTGGGTMRFDPPNRSMTDLEWLVMRPTLDRILAQLSNAWEGLFPLKLRYTNHETNPQLAQNIAPNEPVVLITFELSAGADQSGTMTLCLPHNTIEPVLSRMAGYWFGTKVNRTEDARRNIRAQLDHAGVEMSCNFKPAHMTLRDLSRLEVGDLIRLDHLTTEAVSLDMDGQPVFRGTIGVMGNRNRLCVRVSECLRGENPVA